MTPTRPCPLPRAARTGGFTLLEVLIVVSMIALLMSIVFGAGFAVHRHGKQRVTETSLAALESLASEYHRQYQRYPKVSSSGEAGLSAFMAAVKGVGDCGDFTFGSDNRVDTADGMIDAIKAYLRDDGGQTRVLDGWGAPIRYTPGSTASDDEAAKHRPQFRSIGPDQQSGTSDDVVSSGGFQ